MEDLARRIANLSPEQRLLLEMQLQTRKGLPEPIAIVGMGCRLPGAANLESFWQLLTGGQDAIQEIPSQRWDVAAFYDEDPAAVGKSYCRYGGFLDHVDQFDPEFFGIAPREAAYIDPQQRLFLEVVWEALEDAGLVPRQLAESHTGVFAGASTIDYGQVLLQGTEAVGTYTTTGLASTMVANRVSYLLNLRGPSLTIDTACSSSLVAVHLACQSLWNRESDLALAGGVNLILTPALTVGFSKLTALSPDGRCKAFDAAANGFVRSEGVGVVVLKRLSQAVADGDRIYALVRGSAVNQDGRTNGLTAPNRQSQEAVLQAAYSQAGVALDQVDYIEAHGTGTLLGDPIEAKALGQVFQTVREPSQPVRLGSVKSNIGHTEAAAGIASLIKVALCLHRRTLVPSLHFHQPNPYIPFDQLPLTVQQRLEPWPQTHHWPMAGVSSFGFGGTNAHTVLQGVPQPTLQPSQPERPSQILTLSAPDTAGLRRQAVQFAQFLQRSLTDPTTDSTADLGSICYTANTGRTPFAHRLSAIADSQEELAQTLEDFVAGQANGRCHSGAVHQESPPVVFMFTGQGSQYGGMGHQLYTTQPAFKAALDRCSDLLKPYLDRPLVEVLYGQDNSGQGDELLLHQTQYTQPALFALEYALAQLWLSWGVTPAAVVGHSVGEYVAACIAGVFGLEDGLRLIAQRGKLMQSLPDNGAMAAVFADEATVAAAIAAYPDTVSLATLNGPHNTVIAGLKADVQTVIGQLQQRGVKVKFLEVSHAFHSPLMDPVLNLFEHAARRIAVQPPQIPLVSNLSGQFLRETEAMDAAYWRRHARQPVRFAAALTTLHKAGYQIFLEIGPHPILSAMGQRQISDGASRWLPTLRRQRSDWATLLPTLSELYLQGVEIDWTEFDRPYQRRKRSLPTYPFQRQRYWIDLPTAPALGSAPEPALPSQPAPTPVTTYSLTWEKSPAPAAAVAPRQWLIFSDRRGIGQALRKQLTAAGHQVISVFQGNAPTDGVSLDPAEAMSWQALWATCQQQWGMVPQQVIYLWGLEATDMTPAALETLGQPPLHILQTLSQGSNQPTRRLWLVSQGAQTIEDQANHPWQGLLWGLGRVLRLEHPELWGGLVDLEPQAPSEEIARHLASHLLAADGEDEVALRGSDRYVARLRPHALTDQSSQSPNLRSDGTYLITGGTGALGRATAHWLADHGAKTLVLVSRRGTSAELDQALTALRQRGLTIIVEAVDIADLKAVEGLTTRLRQQHPPLRGIVHAAGTLADGLLTNQSWSQFATVLRPKVLGAWNLQQALGDVPLDWVLLFSSVASLLGSPGQGNYAAANAILDCLAATWQRQGIPTTSINWGPWAEAGMAQAAQEHSHHLTRRGIAPIDPAIALSYLRPILHQHPAQVAIAAIDWGRVAQGFALTGLPPAIASLVTAKSSSAIQLEQEDGEASDRRLQQWLTLPLVERAAALETYLVEAISQVLGRQTPAPIDRPLLDLGIDSLMIMDLLTLCRRDLRLTLYPREVFAHPTIRDLARYLAGELAPEAAASEPITEEDHQFASDGIPTGFWSYAQPLPAPPPQKNSPAVFLLSSPRAGSTLLRVMLAGHGDLFCPPELHLLPFDTLTERQQRLGDSYLHEGLLRALMELMDLDASQTQAMLTEWVDHRMSIQAVYDKLQQLAGSRLLVDKSPTYGLNRAILERGEQLFTGAKYIHLVRHPYAVVDSFVRNRMHKIFNLEPEDPYRLAELVWHHSNTNIRAFLETVDPQRQYFLRYEDLVTRPETTLERLCQFLMVPFDPAVLTPYQGARMTDGIRSRSLAVDDPNFKQRHRIEPDLAAAWKHVTLPRPLQAQSQDLASQFNYELPAVAPTGVVPDPGTPPLAKMAEKRVSVRGLNLCLCQWGPDSGKPILCLHGILQHGAAWDGVATRLAAVGYRVLAPDLRGHGRSDHAGPGGSYQLIEYLADVESLMQQQLPPRFDLVGHSMGAVLAAALTATRPDRIQHLILVEPVVPDSSSGMDAAQQLTAQLTYLVNPPQHSPLDSVAAAAARLQQFTPALTSAAALTLAERLTEPWEQGVRWRWDARLQARSQLGMGDGLFSRDRYRQLLQGIDVPITLIFGDSSQFNRAADLAFQIEALPQARRLETNGGHNLPEEAPAAIARIILEQLEASHDNR